MACTTSARASPPSARRRGWRPTRGRPRRNRRPAPPQPQPHRSKGSPRALQSTLSGAQPRAAPATAALSRHTWTWASCVACPLLVFPRSWKLARDARPETPDARRLTEQARAPRLTEAALSWRNHTHPPNYLAFLWPIGIRLSNALWRLRLLRLRPAAYHAYHAYHTMHTMHTSSHLAGARRAYGARAQADDGPGVGDDQAADRGDGAAGGHSHPRLHTAHFTLHTPHSTPHTSHSTPTLPSRMSHLR